MSLSLWQVIEQAFKSIERSRPSTGGHKGWSRPLPSTWVRYKRNAALTATIDYGCEFKEGRCKHFSSSSSSSNHPDAEKACCVGCAAAFGYLLSIPKGTGSEYARMFNPVDGFWRRGKGCILPREMRSPVCLTYHCYSKVDTHHLIAVGEIRPLKG